MAEALIQSPPDYKIPSPPDYKPAKGEQPVATPQDVAKGLSDTLGFTKGPGSRSMWDVLLNPGVGHRKEDLGPAWLEHAAQMAASAPLFTAGGAGAAALGAPAILGEMAAGALLGASQAKYAGEPMAGRAAIDAAVTGLTHGASRVAGDINIPLSKWGLGDIAGVNVRGAPKRAFDWATAAPGEALKEIKDRLPKAAWLNIPSLQKSPINPVDAVRKLATLTGKEYKRTRQEIISELDRVDIQKWIAVGTEFVKGPKPSAGSIFRQGTSKYRFEPTAGAKVAEAVRPYVTGREATGAAEAIATTPIQGVPAGAPLILPALQWAGHKIGVE